jgi:hypothetical protein
MHVQRLLILSAHCRKEKPRRTAHSPHVAQQTPPAPRLASTTRVPTDSPMCRARRCQSRESRDEPPRVSVRRGGACVGSIPAADKEGRRIEVVNLASLSLSARATAAAIARQSPLSVWPSVWPLGLCRPPSQARVSSAPALCRLPVPRLLDLSPRQYHNGVEARRIIVPAQYRQVRCTYQFPANFTELYSPAMSLCVVLEQRAMLPIMLGGIQSV